MSPALSDFTIVGAGPKAADLVGSQAAILGRAAAPGRPDTENVSSAPSSAASPATLPRSALSRVAGTPPRRVRGVW